MSYDASLEPWMVQVTEASRMRHGSPVVTAIADDPPTLQRLHDLLGCLQDAGLDKILHEAAQAVRDHVAQLIDAD